MTTPLLFGPPPDAILFGPKSGRDPFGRDDDVPLFGPVEDEPNNELIESLPGADRMGLVVTLFMGRRGHGKSAVMVARLEDKLRKYKKFNYGGHLFSNMGLTFARRNAEGKPIDYAHPQIMRTVQTYPQWFSKGDLAVDEIHNYAASRRSMSGSNINLSMFATQLRHRDIAGMFTTQFPQVLDYQLLLQVDLFIDVTILRRWPSKRPDLPGSPHAVKLAIHDYWGQWTGNNWRKPWPPRANDADVHRFMRIPQRIGDMYDTKQIQSSSYWDAWVSSRLEQEESDRMGRGFSSDDEWKGVLDGAIDQAQTEVAHDPGARFPTFADWAKRLPQTFTVSQKVVEAESVSNGAIRTRTQLEEWLNGNGFNVERMKNGVYKAVRNGTEAGNESAAQTA